MYLKKWQLMILALVAVSFVISVIAGVILEWGLFGISKC